MLIANLPKSHAEIKYRQYKSYYAKNQLELFIFVLIFKPSKGKIHMLVCISVVRCTRLEFIIVRMQINAIGISRFLIFISMNKHVNEYVNFYDMQIIGRNPTKYSLSVLYAC